MSFIPIQRWNLRALGSRGDGWRSYVWTLLGAGLFDYILFNVPRPPLAYLLWMQLPMVVACYRGGIGPGLLAAAIAIVGFEHYVASAGIVGAAINNAVLERWLAFWLLNGVICVLIERLHRALHRVEATEQLRAVTLNSIGDAVIATDIQGRINFLNPAAERLSGWRAAEALGRDVAECFPFVSMQAGAQNEISSAIDLTVTRGLTQNTLLRRRNGELLPIDGSVSPIREASGLTHGMVVTLRDRSDSIRAETVAREHAELQYRLATIANVLPGGLHTVRMNKENQPQLEYISDSFAVLVDRAIEEIRQHPDTLLSNIPPEDAAQLMRAVGEGVRTLHPYHFEFRLRHAQRGLRWMALDVAPRREGEDVVLYSIMFDITDRKLTEEQLKESQAQLRAALDAGQIGTLQVDLQTRKARCDDRALGLLGLDAATLQADSEKFDIVLQALLPEDRALLTDSCLRGVQDGEPFRLELRTLAAPDRWIGLLGRCDVQPSGTSRRLDAVLTDVTPRRLAETSRLQSQKLEALGVLAGGIAHDFNNLLMVIGGHTQLLQTDLPKHHPAQNGLREIERASLRATALVKQILTVSQPRASQTGRMALPPLLEEVLGFARAILPTGITIESDLAVEVPDVVADASQVHQALLNLLTNAADAISGSTGRIRVSVGAVQLVEGPITIATGLPPGHYVRVAVADNGSGMDAATLQRIFDPFFTTKAAGKGTGLGLAIVHGVMKGLNGGVMVQSTPGEGTEFSLYFPPADCQDAEAASPAVAPATRTARILYVDDEEALVQLMTRVLQRMGHEVRGFSNPRQALTVFEQWPDNFDVVVTDISMPDLSGFDLAQALLRIRPQLPIIMTSGYVQAEERERARAIGVREVVLKPDTIAELGALLERCIDQ